MPDVGKLRQVLDYWSCETCLEQFDPQQDYLCGVCVKLNREVVVKQTAMARDEAVQVIAPEDFHMARGLRDRIQQQELELQEARSRLKKLGNRENELTERLTDLQKQLEATKREKDAAALVPFELVGVKEQPEEEEMVEFEAEEEPPAPAAFPPGAAPAQEATQWETVPETEPAPEGETPTFEPVADAAPAFEPVTEGGPAAPAPPSAAPDIPPAAARQRVQATDEAISKIEDEISKIESELTQLAEQEKTLQKKGRTQAAAKKTRRAQK